MVASIQEYFKNYWTLLKNLYVSLSKGRKIVLYSVCATILFIFSFLVFWQPSSPYELAFSALPPEDKTAVLAALKKANISNFKLEGESFYFPADKILDIKMILAQEGLPSSGSGIGWEKFDDHTFGMSDFDQHVNKLRAIQGELSRTINKLDPVHGSRVHIVTPEQSVFSNEKKATTASIYINLKSGKSLSKRQIQGILHLVAKAVEGLDPKDIAIVDNEGNILTEPDSEDGGVDKVTSAQREYQKKVERDLEQKIKDILSRVVGFDKVVSKVDANVEFKKVETTISDVDPERTAVIASQKNEQSTTGNGLNPTGVPGAKSNLPGEKEDLQGAGGMTNSSKSNTENLNYEVKKTLSKITEPIGNITKLNASVLVDGKMLKGVYTPRSKEELDMMTKLVKTSIGFVEGRDSLTVETAQFEPDAFTVAQNTATTSRISSLVQTIALSVLGIGAMIFIYLGMLKPYFRWLTFDPDKRSKEHQGVVEYEFEKTGNTAKRVQVQEEVPFEKLPPKEQIMYLAKYDPKKTTEALRQMISPH